MDCHKEDLKHSAEELRKAAEAFARRIFGPETDAHLRQAARHAIKAARSVLDEAEKRLDAGAAKP